MSLFTILLILLVLIFPSPIQAVCPLCTVAVVGGLGLSRFLGIDDTVTGVWIGGLILSSALWLATWLEKKDWHLPRPKLLAFGLMIIMVVPPLYWAKMVGLSGNTLWGVDKVLLGTMIGIIFFFVGVTLDQYLRSTNEGKVYIYYQKVILPVLLLTLASVAFFLLTI